MQSSALFCRVSIIASAWSAVLYRQTPSIPLLRKVSVPHSHSRSEPDKPSVLFHLLFERRMLRNHPIPFQSQLICSGRIAAPARSRRGDPWC